jgi:Putative zinc-finger
MSSERSCDDWQDLLPAYQSGRLTASEQAEMTEHLATCATCQRAAASWANLTASLQSAARAVPPPPSDADVWKGLESRLRADANYRGKRDVSQYNGHRDVEEVEFELSTIARQHVPQRRPSNWYATVAAIVVVALFAILFGALAARHRVPASVAQPTATPITLPPALPIPGNLFAAAAIGGTNFWIGGDDLLASYDGHGGWQKIAIPSGASIKSISMVTPTEGWAVGGIGNTTPILMHDHNGVWQTVPPPEIPTRFIGTKIGVKMASANDGWLWDGVKLFRLVQGIWTSVTTPFDPSLIAFNAVDPAIAATPGEAWVSVGYTLWHFHHDEWIAEGNFGSHYVHGLSMVSSTEGWAVGNLSGAKPPILNDIWHYDGSAWSPFPSAPDVLNQQGYAIDQLFIYSHDDGWASTTFPGHLLRYHQGQWSLATIPANLLVQQVLTLGPDDAWAIGSTITSPANVILLRYHNGVWQS